MSGSDTPNRPPQQQQTPMREQQNDVKIVVLGDGGVGKSALTMQFVCHRFLDYHDPTIEDAYRQQARIDGIPTQMDILDTAGQPEFTAMREQYMRTGDGFLICYSVTDRRSFEEAQEYKTLVNRVRNSEDNVIPCVLVGNKCDLDHLRKVGTEEGRALADRWECPFFETSAALRQYVDDAFHGLIREIRRKELEAIQGFQKRKKKGKSKGFKSFFTGLFKSAHS